MRDIEQQLIAHLLWHPEHIELAHAKLPTSTLSDPYTRAVYEALRVVPERGLLVGDGDQAVDTLALVEHVVAAHRACNGSAMEPEQARGILATITDNMVVLDTSIETFLGEVQRAHLQRRASGILSTLSDDLLDEGAYEDLIALRSDMLTQRDSSDPALNPLLAHCVADELAWEHLDDYTPPGAIVPGLLYPRTVSVLAGDPMVGKSALVMHVAQCVALGEPAWSGCPEPEPANVLYISFDEILPQLAKRLRQLNMLAGPTRSLTVPNYRYGVGAHETGVVLFGLSPTTPPGVIERYRLPDGAAHLDHDLGVARKVGMPIGGIVIDTMSRAMRGLKEDVASDMTLLVDQLAQVAVRHDCWILLLHHLRKGGKEDGDPFERIRGSGAILGCVRAAGLLERAGDNNLRLLRCRTNLDSDPATVIFEVAPAKEPGSILYWRTMTTIDEVPALIFKDDDELLQGVIICRLLELPDDTKMKDVNGDKRTAKRRIITRWQQHGWVTLSSESTKTKKLWRITDRGRATLPAGEDEPVQPAKPEDEVNLEAMFGAQKKQDEQDEDYHYDEEEIL